MMEEIDFVLLQTESVSEEVFSCDPVLKRAVVRSLEIIGEAAAKMPYAFRVEHPQIEWRKIIALRNKLIHEYFGVDYGIVWDVATNILPDLKKQLAYILEE